MIEFKKTIEKAKMIDPSGNLLEQKIEQRIDPLTGNVASINSFLGEKAKAFLGYSDIEIMHDLEEKTKENCPFCNVFDKGTKYTEDFCKEGRFILGNSVAMPNLFSKCTFDSVIIINYKNHTLFPKKIDVQDFYNAIRLGKSIIEKAKVYDSSLKHHVLGMNFLNPGGSSVPHPHFQLHIRQIPYSGVYKLISLSNIYFKSHGKNYWQVLYDEEKSLNERFIAEDGDVFWVSAFAPSHQREIWGILKGKSSILEMNDLDAKNLAKGISKIVSYYEDINNHPFTLAFFSSHDNNFSDCFWLQVRICSRPAFKNLYANYDTWFAPKFIGDEAHTTAPEEYAKHLRETWNLT